MDCVPICQTTTEGGQAGTVTTFNQMQMHLQLSGWSNQGENKSHTLEEGRIEWHDFTQG